MLYWNDVIALSNLKIMIIGLLFKKKKSSMSSNGKTTRHVFLWFFGLPVYSLSVLKILRLSYAPVASLNYYFEDASKNKIL